MGAMLDSDILYSIISEVAESPAHGARDLKSISVTSRLLRELVLPVLFAEVRWPHGDKHSEEQGLEFFPESLWRYFRKLSLLWPDHWPDSSPPLWGDRYYIGGDYHPRHIGKLVQAMPQMPGLAKLHISCPFYPPSSIFTALVQCPSIRSLSISDTPLYMSMIPRVPPEFHLEHLSLVPVAEALRVGEGPYDPKYQEVAYYIREYRKKYRNDSLARYAADALLFNFAKASALRCVQVSGDMCTLYELARHDWPNLHTLIITGHAPRPFGGTELVDVVSKMPKLIDLRLLFATVKNDPLFPVLPLQTIDVNSPSVSSPLLVTSEGRPAAVLSQLRYLAMSNACQLSGTLFHNANQLERLAICAISDLPRVPVALSRAEVDALMNGFGAPPAPVDGSTATAPSSRSVSPYPTLKQLRIMIEDKANPELCHKICELFPHLEKLEVELCGYHDGKSIYAWDEFVSALRPVRASLKQLRLCIQFPEFDETDRGEPWRNARRECAGYFASRLGGLRRVGFEYRKRTGTHRYEDSWLEFDVERCGVGLQADVRMHEDVSGVQNGARVHHGRSGYGPVIHQQQEHSPESVSDVKLVELPSSWYRHPEVWTPEYIMV